MTGTYGWRQPARYVSSAAVQTRRSEIDGLPGHGPCRLAEDLGQGRVCVHAHAELGGGALDELGVAALGDQLGHVRADGVHAEDEVGLRVGDDLAETVGLALDQGLADGPERDLRLPDLVAPVLRLRPAQAALRISRCRPVSSKFQEGAERLVPQTPFHGVAAPEKSL